MKKSPPPYRTGDQPGQITLRPPPPLFHGAGSDQGSDVGRAPGRGLGWQQIRQQWDGLHRGKQVIGTQLLAGSGPGAAGSVATSSASFWSGAGPVKPVGTGVTFLRYAR